MKKGGRLLKGMQMGVLALVVVFGLLTIIATDDSDEVVQRIKDLIKYTGKTTPVQFTETNAREVVEGALGFRVLDGHGAAAGDSRAESVLETLLSQRPVAEMLLLVNQFVSGMDFDLDAGAGTLADEDGFLIDGPWGGDLYIEPVIQGSQQALIFKFREFNWYGLSLDGDIEKLLAVDTTDPDKLILENLVTFSCGGSSQEDGCSGFYVGFPGGVHPSIYLMGSALVDITSNIVETDGLLDFDMTLVKDFDTLPIGYDPLVVCKYAGCPGSATAQNGTLEQFELTGGGTTTIEYKGPAQVSMPSDDNLTSPVTMGLAGSYDINTNALGNMTTIMLADPEELVVSGKVDIDLTYDHTGFTLAKTFTQFVLQHLDLYFYGDGRLTMTGEFDHGVRLAGGTPYHKIIDTVFKNFTWSLDYLGEREYLLNGGLKMDYKQYYGMTTALDEPWEVWLQGMLRESETTFTIDDMTVSSPWVSLSFDGTKTLTMMSDTQIGDGWDALLPAHITGDMLVRNNLADPPEVFWFKDYEVVVSFEAERQQDGQSEPALSGNYVYYAETNGTFYDPAWGVVDFTTDGTGLTGLCEGITPAAIGIPEYTVTPDRGLVYYRGLLPTGKDFFSSAYIGASCCGTYDIRVDVEGNCTYAEPPEWQGLDWDDLFWNLFGSIPDTLNQ